MQKRDIQDRHTKAVDGRYRERLYAARKAAIEQVIWQRNRIAMTYLTAFGEPMEEAIKRRFENKHTML